MAVDLLCPFRALFFFSQVKRVLKYQSTLAKDIQGQCGTFSLGPEQAVFVVLLATIIREQRFPN